MKASLTLCLVTLMLFTSGCATLLIPRKQKITINTYSEDTEIFLDGKKFGRGSSVTGKLTKSKQTTLHQVTIKREGYKDSHTILAPKGRHPLFYPLQIPYFFLLFMPTIADLSSTKTFWYNKEFQMNPQIEIPKRDSTMKYLELYRVGISDWESNENFEIIKVKKSRNYELALQTAESDPNSRSNNVSPDYTASADYWKSRFELGSVNEKLAAFLYENNYLDTIHEVFTDRNNTYSLEGDIKKISVFEIKCKGWSTMTKTRLNITWYLRNDFGERIDSIPQTVCSDLFVYSRFNQAIHDAVESGYLQLCDSDAFLDKMVPEHEFPNPEKTIELSNVEQIVKNPDDALEATVTIKTVDGHGSGFAVSNDGYIVTNYHVISDGKYGPSDSLTVVTPEGKELKARVIQFNKYRDVALLKVESQFAKAFAIPSKKTYAPFQEFYALGAPKSVELGNSYNAGLFSNERLVNEQIYLQLFMSINGGNSGGPVFDATGGLQGVVVSKLIGRNTESIGFAIPAYKLSEYLNIKVN